MSSRKGRLKKYLSKQSRKRPREEEAEKDEDDRKIAANKKAATGSRLGQIRQEAGETELTPDEIFESSDPDSSPEISGGQDLGGGDSTNSDHDPHAHDPVSDGKTKSRENPILKIRKVKTRKDNISNPILSDQDLIPRLGTSSILVGTTGQGKSTLLTNLISSEHFYGSKEKKVFDHKFLISPTAEGDDVQKKLGIPKENTFTDLDEAPEMIQIIMHAQKEKIKTLGADSAPQILLIFDDVISEPQFMRSNEFIKCFIASRHFNLTVFVCSQSWTSVPRRCRIQCKNVFYFAGPQSEMDHLCEEYCPPGMNRKQFLLMLDYATKEPFSFMYINKSVPMKERYRKRLGEQINLDYFRNIATSSSRGIKQTSSQVKNSFSA